MKLSLILAAAMIVLIATVGGTPRTVRAAIDCATNYDLQIDFIDLEGERVLIPGAYVTIRPDPQDGAGSRVYVDNGQNDASITPGRILEPAGCSTTEGSLYSLEVGYLGDRCTPQIDPPLEVALDEDLIGEDAILVVVHDCFEPTPIPTATSTPRPPTATPSPTMAPIDQIWVPCADGSWINLVAGGVCPTPKPSATPVPTAPAASVTGTGAMISPPNTGDGGLR